MRRRRGALASLALSLALVTGMAAGKGQLQAGPILIEMPAGSTAGRMTLSNSGDAPVAAQVRVYAWSQVQGEDQLTPTTEVVVSPPIIEIPAKAQQLVRLVRQGATATGRDRTYRIVVDELPGDAGQAERVVHVRMRYVIPLYVRARGATAPTLDCRLETAALLCVNQGGQAAQLATSRLVDGAGHHLSLSEGLFGYVLPGSARRWPLNREAVITLTTGLRLETRVNGQSTTLPVARAS